MLKGGIQKNVPAFQSAMYKDKNSNSAFDFFNNVQNDFNKYKKAKYQFKTAKLSVPADTIRHDNKHELSATDWNEIENNIENIYIANKVNDKSAFGDDLYNFGIKTQNGDYYYLCVAINRKDNYIVTAAKNTKNGVDSYVTGKGKTPAKVPNALSPVAPFSQVSSNNIINYLKRNFNPTEFINNNIKENFGYSAEELENNFKSDIKNILEENGVDYDEFEIEDIKLYGSYTTGKNKDTSDLDVIVQYKGSMREDSAFDLLNSEKLTIVDVNGIEREVDINPINSALSGTIEDHIEYMNELDSRFQSAITTGAKQNEVSDAINEWQKKGVESKYFKKWFGDSKVVDENSKPKLLTDNKDIYITDGYSNNGISRYSYKGSHRSPSYSGGDVQKRLENSEDVNLFEVAQGYHNQPDDYFSPMGARYYMYDDKEQEADLYLKIENPKYQDVLPANWKEARELRNQGYDGVITSDGKYLVFEKTQIKSVDNRGTFDENNPNIYYQSAKVGSVNNSEKYKNLPQNLKDAVDYIFNGKPVYNITGEEFPNNGENLNERINKYYKDNFDNKIKVDSIGEIKLDKRSIKDSIYHGINTDKVNAFKAVPHVIKNGKSLDVSKPQNNGELRYLFVAPITLKGEDYYCEVVVKSNKDRQGFYIHEVELKEKLADVFSTAHHGTSTSSKSIIANLVNNFNPATYKQEIQPSLFEGNNKAREIHKVKGSFMPAEKIIELFKNADISTIIHEYAHWYLSVMERYASVSAEVEEDLNEVRKFVKNSGEEFTQEQHEKFARGFEAYLRAGKAPTYRLKKAFEHFKSWLHSIYNRIESYIFKSRTNRRRKNNVLFSSPYGVLYF